MSKSQRFINHFLSHRKVTEELVSKISKDHYEYNPTPTSMSTKELVIHMLTSFYRFAAFATQQTPKQLHEEDAEINITELAERYTKETVSLIETMSDEDFKTEIDVTHIIGVKLPAGQLLQLALDHEINHKGNLFVYVREMGHTDLPLFVNIG
ncbi:DinB family protein [Alteribacter populi]|uniref:DinB family protein n=1 Tax=Alteribacter populi TaxID=2011011 RepID=UPI000BBAAD4B|nr:DinB family protein [Alteribacter populi]